jgi:uncharacterized protein (DUF1697 family)
MQFEEAFLAAGAPSASSFLTNGTMVFKAASDSQARKVFAGACDVLRGTCGLKEPGYIRRVDYLAELVARDPFAAVEPGNVYERCTSFVHPQSSPLAKLPSESKRRDVRILTSTESEVFSVSLKIGSTPGSPNAFLEKILGLPVTTRNWNTLVRLIQRHA